MPQLRLKYDNCVQKIPICVHALVSSFELGAGISLYIHACLGLLIVESLQAKRSLQITFAPSPLIPLRLLARIMEYKNTVN